MEFLSGRRLGFEPVSSEAFLNRLGCWIKHFLSPSYVRLTGIEPAHPKGYEGLNLARLPITPQALASNSCWLDTDYDSLGTEILG